MKTEILFYLQSDGWNLIPNPVRENGGVEPITYLAKVVDGALLILEIQVSKGTYKANVDKLPASTQALLNLAGITTDRKDPLEELGIKLRPRICSECNALDNFDYEEDGLVCQTCGTPVNNNDE